MPSGALLAVLTRFSFNYGTPAIEPTFIYVPPMTDRPSSKGTPMDLSRIDAYMDTSRQSHPRPFRCAVDKSTLMTEGRPTTYASLDQACEAGKAALGAKMEGGAK